MDADTEPVRGMATDPDPVDPIDDDVDLDAGDRQLLAEFRRARPADRSDDTLVPPLATAAGGEADSIDLRDGPVDALTPLFTEP